MSIENWKPFEKARKYTRSLKLKSRREWSTFCKNNQLPEGIPTAPDRVYKNCGWIDWYDWLGKPSLENRWLSYSQAKKAVHSLKLCSKLEWTEYIKSKPLPSGVPMAPVNVYKRTGHWKSWKDWLGYKQIRKRVYPDKWLPYEESRKYVHTLKLRSMYDWRDYTSNNPLPEKIPRTPYGVYRNKGWISWHDWLGYDEVNYRPEYNFIPFEEARNYARSLQLKSGSEWRQYCKSGKLTKNIPHTPDNIYKNDGWISWYDWLGKTPISDTWLSFKEARKFAQSLNLHYSKEWDEYCKDHKLPEGIPRSPKSVYKKEWINWHDWLGKSWPGKIWMPFEDARNFARNLNLNSSKEWMNYRDTHGLPDNVPSWPDNVYRNKGWISWYDWFGKDSPENYLPYKKARTYVHKLKITSQSEWKKYIKTGKLPNYIPPWPEGSYQNKGWISWYDWLGTKKPLDKLPYKKARNLVRKLKLESQSEWRKFVKDGKCPENIPRQPEAYYQKRHEWIDWYDWLGKPRHKFSTFKKARTKVHALTLSNEEEWFEVCSKDQIPDDIPVNPHVVYEKEGWIGWENWLGKS